MAPKLDLKKLNLSSLPMAARIAVAFLPALIITVLVVYFLIMPKHKEIQKLKTEITKQENEIAKDQAKVAKLAVLRAENERLTRRLDELKLQLPEEKEVSGLLRQISDLGIKSGLKISLWKPEQRKEHPSGVIYEIPVSVELFGSYHNLGMFFSSLTKLNRIVNIGDFKALDPKPDRNTATLKVTFKATTFSAMGEKEIEERAAAKAAKPKGKK